jgi:arylformamidase
MKNCNWLLISFLFLLFVPAASAVDFKIIPNVQYGSDDLQKIDIYAPNGAKNAPVIVMVHGGGWAMGDKSNPNVVKNKGEYFLSHGFVFVSVNYRMLPKADPITQANDVASALAYVQKYIARWNGDPDKIILMGHSAGAHLVALLSADSSIATAQGARLWQGSVFLDSAALDVSAIMTHPHFSFFNDAFGRDPKYWDKASPITHLTKQGIPALAVCSSQRILSCPEAEKFAAKARTLNVSVTVLPQNLTHEEINETLGLPGDYTKAVDGFISARFTKSP